MASGGSVSRSLVKENMEGDTAAKRRQLDITPRNDFERSQRNVDVKTLRDRIARDRQRLEDDNDTRERMGGDRKMSKGGIAKKTKKK